MATTLGAMTALALTGETSAQAKSGVGETASEALAPLGAPDAPCELHIWPSSEIGHSASGLLSNFGLVGAMLDRSARAGRDKAEREGLEARFDAHAQLMLLKSLDPERLLGLGALRVVPHDEPVSADAIERFSTRRAGTPLPCYYELYLTDMEFRRSRLGGSKMQFATVLRSFAGRTALQSPVTIRDKRTVDLKGLTLDNNIDDPEGTSAETARAIRSAFELSINLLGEKLVLAQRSGE